MEENPLKITNNAQMESVVDAHDPKRCYATGVAYQRKGDLRLARDYLEKAIKLDEKLVEAHFRLAVLDTQDGQLDAAIVRYQTCIRLFPELWAAYNNLGLILKAQNRLDQSIACFEKAVKLNPQSAEALTNLGSLFHATGSVDKALAYLQAAVSANQDDAAAHFNLALVLMAQDDKDAALAAFENAIRCDTTFPQAYNSMGILLKRMGKTEKAIQCFESVVGSNPHYAPAVYNLGKVLQDACEWEKLEKCLIRMDQQTQEAIAADRCPAEEPFFNITRSQDLRLNLEVARQHSKAIAKRALAHHHGIIHSVNGSYRHHNKPIVGYLSDGFNNHPTGHLMKDVFRLHDRKAIRAYCYSYGIDDGSVYRHEIEKGCDRFIDLNGLRDGDAADRIHADKVDILVDLKGHTAKSRLGICALRPAPVQVRYLGMPGTTGADFFDYLIADAIVVPEGDFLFYSEKIVHLPHCYQVNSYPVMDPKINPECRQRIGLPDNGIVFAAFLSGYKIDPLIFETWMAILRRVPESVLWLWSREKRFNTNLLREANLRAIASSRLIFAEELQQTAHLHRLRHADICLDTWRVSGAATTSDALWAGVPVVTLRGQHYASRMSASILNAVGLPELVADNLKEYEHMALRLATDDRFRVALRNKLADNQTIEPLFDTRRAVRNLENAFSQIWARHLTGKHPRHIRVEDGGPNQNNMPIS